ncbi:MAG: hypothetical protein WCD76_09615, partial [Pyrinomonadaceae bacterium]
LWLVALAGRLLVARPSSATRESVDTARRRLPLMSWVVWGFGGPLMLLYAFDVGVMTLLALALTVGVAVACTLRLRRGGEAPAPCRDSLPASTLSTSTLPASTLPALRRNALYRAAIMTLGGVIFVIVCAVVPGWKNYLPDSWRIVAGYSHVMAAGGTTRDFLYLALAGVVMCAGLWLARRHVRENERQDAAGSGGSLALLAGLCFALVWLRYGLTRSNAGAIQLALAPALFMAGAFFPCYLRARGEKKLARLAWLAALPLVLLSPFGLAAPTGAWQRGIAARNLEPSRAFVIVEDRNMREAAAFARQLDAPALYVWPHASLVNLISRKPSPAYTVQSYAATSPALEDATVERLRMLPDTPVLLMTKDWPVDEVENLTRTPRIFRYLLENYELADRPRAAFFLLRRAQNPGAWLEQPLMDGDAKFAPTADNAPGSLEVKFTDERAADARAMDARARDARVSDLFMLRLAATRTPLYGVGKPGRLTATFLLSNGTEQKRVILLPPDGEPHDALISLTAMDSPLFATLFSASRVWRSRERVVGVRLNWSPLDMLSLSPKEITLRQISVLRRAGVEAQETSLSEADDPAVGDWCFDYLNH